MLEEEKSGEAQKSGREKQPRALLAPCTFEISRPEQHSVMKMKSAEVGGMMKEPTWGVKAAYGRVTPHLGSFYSLYRHVSRFRKI